MTRPGLPVGSRALASATAKLTVVGAKLTTRLVITGLKYSLAILGVYVLGKLVRVPQDVKTRLIHSTKKKPAMVPETVRTIFMDLELVGFKVPENHTHAKAAADRSTSSLFIDRLARNLGKTAYYVQKSRSDVRNGRIGSRAYYWAKDLVVEPESMEINEHDLVTMVDVDQYVDMPSFLTTNVQPTLLYTFQPTQVARTTDNYSYTFNENSVVDYHVAGGGRFSHQVWNYSTDHVVVKKKWWFITYSSAAYLVDRRQTSLDHELIMFTPLGSWSLIGSQFVNMWLEGRELLRLAVTTPKGYLRLVSSSKDGVKVSTGKCGSYICANVSAEIDDTVASIARTSKYDLTMPQVLSHLNGDKPAAAALLEFYRFDVPTKPDVVCPVEEAVRSYQFNPNNYDSEAKPMMKAFMTPMVHGAFVPSNCKNNEEECISARIDKPKPLSMQNTPFLSLVMREFLERFIPNSKKNTLDPTDYDEVLDRQNKPTQRRLLSMAEACVPIKRAIQMFMKKEPYPDVKPPRPISTFNTVDKRDYSRFIYALEVFLKDADWYAFGKTPKDISKRVTEILLLADFATPTDYSKFDGHGSNLMREFERMLLTRAFRVGYHGEVLELHKSQYGLKGYGRHGTAYQVEFARGSGSPETSVFNTIFNAFIAFLAYRMTKVNGLFIQPDEAYKRLGIYGGDDGLSVGIKPAVYVKAARLVGQELTIEVIKRGDSGIKFLARVYSPDVWQGDTSSCCDIKRQVVKFHVTVNLPSDVTPAMKLLEKTRAFLLSDENTPVIGDYCRRVLQVHTREEKQDAETFVIEKNEKTHQIRGWLSKFEKEKQYDNTPGTWMNEYLELSLPEFDYKKFTKWLDEADTMDKLLKPPMFMAPIEAKPSAPVVLEDEILPREVKEVKGLISPIPIPVPLFPLPQVRAALKEVPDGVRAPRRKNPYVAKVLRTVVENIPSPNFKAKPKGKASLSRPAPGSLDETWVQKWRPAKRG